MAEHGLFCFHSIHYNRVEMGVCDTPRVSKVAAIILLIINIFAPGMLFFCLFHYLGLGTIVGALVNEGGCDGGMVCGGLLQMFFCYLLVPWIWSIVTGVKMVQNSTN